MKKYYKGEYMTPLAETEKAMCFTVVNGRSHKSDSMVWLPKSQLIVGEPNECGWMEILIPVWLLRSNGLKAWDCCFREIENCSGEDVIVER